MEETMRELKPLRDEDMFPAVFRWGGVVLGVILVADALRRFLIPGSERDLYGFLIYLLLGGFCLVLAGYRRAFLLGGRGLVRETTVWGRSTERILLSWEDLTDLSWDPVEGAGTLRLVSPGVVWRLRLDGEQASALRAWVDGRRPDLGDRLSARETAGRC